MRKVLLFAFLLLLAAPCFAGPCKAGQYDMLGWMAPQIATVNGHWNVVEADTGTFYWVKGSAGYPWDKDTFDDNYIYQVVTELTWNDPKTYKIFEQPMPWMPRCITMPATPDGKLATITLQNVKYDTHTSCTAFTVQSLGNVVNEIWGPSLRTIGTNPPAATLTLSYRYVCDQNFANCQFKETFDMQKGNGLVQWTYYKLGTNGQYAEVQSTTHGLALSGTVMPVHPCWP